MEEIRFEADHAHKGRARLSVAFRPLIALPLGIVGIWRCIQGFAGGVLAYLVLILAGRYPRSLHRANVRTLRYGLRAGGYALLVSDRFPPLGGADDPSYPIRLEIDRRRRHGRLGVLLRPPLLIGVGLIYAAYTVVAIGRAFLSGTVILLTGRHTRRAHRAAASYLDFAARAGAYALYLTDSLRAGSEATDADPIA